VADVPVKTVTFAQAVNGVPLFGGLVIFWKRLDKHTASLQPNLLIVNTTGRTTLEKQKQGKSKTPENQPNANNVS